MEDLKNPQTLPISKVIVSAFVVILICLSGFDGFGIDGVVPLIQSHYNIKDAETAMIKTTSSIVHTATLAMIWIFGDSFKRRRLYLGSVAFWLVSAMLSLVLGIDSFMMFVVFRALASAGSAAFGVLSPVIMADLFQDRALGVSLMCLSVAELLSSLFPDIVSSWIVASQLPWQSGLIICYGMGIVPLLYLLCAKKHIRNVEKKAKGLSSIVSGAFGFFYIKSLLLMTFSETFIMFHKKAYIFWFPSMNLIAWTNYPDLFFGLSYTTVTAMKSFTMLIGTLIGIPVMMWIGQNWRFRTGPFAGGKEYLNAYTIVTSSGAALSCVAFIASIILADQSFIWSLVSTFLTGFGSAAIACLGQQMMLMVIPSNSRAAGFALSRLTIGLFTIPSAQIVGMVSDAFRGDSTLPYDRFHAYQLGLLCSSSFLVAGSICSVAVLFFFRSDCKRAEDNEKGDCHEVDEKSSLIGKERSESILETVNSTMTDLESMQKAFATKKYGLKLELQPAEIIQYTTELSTTSFTALQKELLEATKAHARLPIMIGASEIHEMGKSMIAVTKTKKVLDIGTFTGASALAFAIELPKDGKVVSMDINHDNLEKVGLPIIEKAPELRAKIDFRLGSGEAILRELITNGESETYGLAFIDADKENYSTYYELCLQLLVPGGVIMVDNALWNGWVVEPTKHRAIPESIAIDKLNRLAAADDRVHNTLLNIDDGIHLIVKKH